MKSIARMTIVPNPGFVRNLSWRKALLRRHCLKEVSVIMNKEQLYNKATWIPWGLFPPAIFQHTQSLVSQASDSISMCWVTAVIWTCGNTTVEKTHSCIPWLIGNHHNGHNCNGYIWSSKYERSVCPDCKARRESGEGSSTRNGRPTCRLAPSRF